MLPVAWRDSWSRWRRQCTGNVPPVSSLSRRLIRVRRSLGLPSSDPALQNPDRLRYYFSHPVHPFVMCASPKVGSSTLKGWFLNSATDLKQVVKHIHTYESWDRFWLADQPKQEIIRQFETRLLFGFVREPISRVTSAYVDKYVRAGDPPTMKGAVRFLESATGRTYDKHHPGMTFREFVDEICRTRDRQLDPHWRSQTYFVADVPRLRLIRLEHLNEVVGQISEILDMKPPVTRHSMPYRQDSEEFVADVPSRELVRVAWDGVTDKKPHLPRSQQFLDDEIVAKLEKRFKADFALRNNAAEGLVRERSRYPSSPMTEPAPKGGFCRS